MTRRGKPRFRRKLPRNSNRKNREPRTLCRSTPPVRTRNGRNARVSQSTIPEPNGEPEWARGRTVESGVPTTSEKDATNAVLDIWPPMLLSSRSDLTFCSLVDDDGRRAHLYCTPACPSSMAGFHTVHECNCRGRNQVHPLQR